LVDEAKAAMVITSSYAVKYSAFDGDTKWLAGFFGDGESPEQLLFASLNEEDDTVTIGQALILNYVRRRNVINRGNGVTHHHSNRRRWRRGRN